jgi:uncharacterized protein
MNSPDLRWVFDTNAAVSALLFEQSVPGKALHAGLQQGTILQSEATIAELSAVLARKKFDRYLTRDQRDQFLVMLLQVAIIVEISEEIRASRDPKDDKFFELALSGKASCLVSGDADLLALNPFRGIPILNPAAFLTWLPKANPDAP